MHENYLRAQHAPGAKEAEAGFIPAVAAGHTPAKPALRKQWAARPVSTACERV